MCQQKADKLNLRYQKGYTLILVLSITLLISIIIISTTRSIINNRSMINNNLDRKYVFELANLALNIAEKEIAQDIVLNKIPFPNLGLYNQNKYPVVFTQLLEGGPLLEKTLDYDKKNTKNRYFEQIFTNNCKFNNKTLNIKGLCAPSVVIDGTRYGGNDGTPSWNRIGVFDNNDNLELNSREITNDKLSHRSFKNPRYIVEFLGITFPERNILLRVTLRAWGKDKNTKVTLQSYLEINQEL